MSTKIFVNITVKNLDASMKFWKALGYSFNKQFTNASAGCLVISKDIYAMLLMPKTMKRFTKKEIVNAKKQTEVINTLSMSSKKEVDAMFAKAIKAGAKESRPAEDAGFMYGRSFEDLDSHIWEFFWMDPKFVKKS